jgi:hypothetical protein
VFRLEFAWNDAAADVECRFMAGARNWMYSNFPFMVPGARSSVGDVQTAGAY